MLNMSFFDGTLNREVLIKFIENYKKPIKFTYGLGYRNPTTHNKLIAKEEALEIAEKESFLDAREDEECLQLNAYSANDLF